MPDAAPRAAARTLLWCLVAAAGARRGRAQPGLLLRDEGATGHAHGASVGWAWAELAAAGGHADSLSCLEVRRGEGCLAWAGQQSERTVRRFGGAGAGTGGPPGATSEGVLAELVPQLVTHGRYVYSLVGSRAAAGQWSRAPLDSFMAGDPQWETVFDVATWSDAGGPGPRQCRWLGCDFAAEAVPQDSTEAPSSQKGAEPPSDLCLMRVACGRTGAVQVREFDVGRRAFVEPPRGFSLTEARTIISYEGPNSVLVATTAVHGPTTHSGEPLQFRRWTRGGRLEDMEVVHEGSRGDLGASARRVFDRLGFVYDVYGRTLGAAEAEWRVRVAGNPGLEAAGEAEGAAPLQKLQVPADAEIYTFADQLLVLLHSDWGEMVDGTLIATSLADMLEDEEIGGFEDEWAEWVTLFEPTGSRWLRGFVKTKSYIVLNVLDNVRSQLVAWQYNGNYWGEVEDRAEPSLNTFTIFPIDAREDDFWLLSEGFLDPPELARVAAGNLRKRRGVLEQRDERAGGLALEGVEPVQHWVRSADGARVPFFLVGPRGSGEDTPTLLCVYGGFGVPALPFYSAALREKWLARGGALVLAGVRGGGELGPAWHKAARRGDRERSFQDLEAVARHLVASGVTSPAKLALWGIGPGGLLACGLLLRLGARLLGAAVCEAPLLDLGALRRLGDAGPPVAGRPPMLAIEEYGDPDDNATWERMRGISPYHLALPGAEYPPVLLLARTAPEPSWTAHPAHARRLAAKLQQTTASGRRAFLYEQDAAPAAWAPAPDEAWPSILRAFVLDPDFSAVRFGFLAGVLGLDEAGGEPPADGTPPPAPPCEEEETVLDNDTGSIPLALAATALCFATAWYANRRTGIWGAGRQTDADAGQAGAAAERTTAGVELQ